MGKIKENEVIRVRLDNFKLRLEPNFEKNELNYADFVYFNVQSTGTPLQLKLRVSLTGWAKSYLRLWF